MFPDTEECPTRLTPGAIRALLRLRLYLGLRRGLVPGPGTATGLPGTCHPSLHPIMWLVSECLCFVLQLVDHRQQFSKWWLTEFKTIKFPNQGTIFDYYIDPKTKKFSPWDERVPEFELDPDVPLQVFPTSSVFIWFI